jgi:hypothetical protein
MNGLNKKKPISNIYKYVYKTVKNNKKQNGS